MNDDLSQAIQDQFAHLTTPRLIRRMENLPDFKYDDEAHELNRRLKKEGQTWRWKNDHEVELIPLEQ